MYDWEESMKAFVDAHHDISVNPYVSHSIICLEGIPVGIHFFLIAE